jgi:ComF family protein
MPGLISNLLDRANYVLEDIFAFISAPMCPGCGNILENPRLALCPSCDDKLDFAGDGPICMLCRSPSGIECNCGKGQRFRIPELYYWAPYNDLVRLLIHKFKFEGQTELGRYLIKKALARLSGRLLKQGFDIIIPIPMIKRDKKRRSFNQSELIAENISALSDIPMNFDSLKKIKPTRLQADLGREDRWHNVTGAFSIENSEPINGRLVLLVDDIVTTGATCLEAAEALYSSGAKSVTVFSIASSHFEDEYYRGQQA